MTDQRIIHNQIFDGVRAISILLVVYFHVNFGIVKLLDAEALQSHMDNLPFVLNISWQALGSEIIFFVSGYLLTMILLIEYKKQGSISISNFYVKRVARILPLYYIAMILFSFASSYSMFDWVTNVLFVSKVLGEKTIIPVGWSLELQMQFFILVPLVVILLNKTGRPLLILFLLLLSALWLRYDLIVSDPVLLSSKFPDVIMGEKPSQAQQDSYYLIPYRMSALIMGMLLAYFYVFYKEHVQRIYTTTIISKILLVLGVILTLVFGFMPIHNIHSFVYQSLGDGFYVFYMVFQRFFFALGVCLIILKLLFNPGSFSFMIGFLGNRLFKMISDSIYPIYLFHFPFVLIAFVLVYQTIDKDAVNAVNLFQLSMLIIVSTILATGFSRLVHRFIERPLQTRIRNRFLQAEKYKDKT